MGRQQEEKPAGKVGPAERGREDEEGRDVRGGEALAEQRRGEGGRPGGWRGVVEDVGEELHHARI